MRLISFKLRMEGSERKNLGTKRRRKREFYFRGLDSEWFTRHRGRTSNFHLRWGIFISRGLRGTTKMNRVSLWCVYANWNCRLVNVPAYKSTSVSFAHVSIPSFFRINRIIFSTRKNNHKITLQYVMKWMATNKIVKFRVILDVSVTVKK